VKLIDEAIATGARQRSACAEAGYGVRTIQRWRINADDRRGAAVRTPANKLTDEERQRVLTLANSPEFRDLSPKQIVPKLADRGTYLASESTIYRVLRAEDQMKHRATSRPATHRVTRERTATDANQLWSWDITYLKTVVRGEFYFLYLVEDVWSRKIVGWAVHERESPDLAAQLITRTCRDEGIAAPGLVLHSDNGSPMKGATMLATMQRLGIVPSFSRPSVSDDNPYSESLFRTLKYRPNYPTKPFQSLLAATTWVEGFVRWYNTQHLHSGLRFVTPADRHAGHQQAILARRATVYRRARRRTPERWRGPLRNWSPIGAVTLNPAREKRAA
jgi:putative transposase